MALGHSFASASARPSGIPLYRSLTSRLPRMPVVMLLQLGAATLGLRKRTPQSHLLWFGHRESNPSAVCRIFWSSLVELQN